MKEKQVFLCIAFVLHYLYSNSLNVEPKKDKQETDSNEQTLLGL